MITAKYIDTDETVNIMDHDNPRSTIDKNRLVCKFCNGQMSVKDGLNRAKHFFHLSKCSSDFERHAESAEHNIGKVLIAKHVKEYWEEFSKVDIEFEYPLPEIKRIADIAMIFPSGWLVAHEIQLSSITNEQLEKRTIDYNSVGVDVFWWLGKSADTRTNRDWCIRKFGYSLAIDYELLESQVKSLRRSFFH